MVCWYGMGGGGNLNEYAVKPLKILQRKIVRICLGRNTLTGSTGDNFKQLEVLPVEIVYKKVTILYIVKNYETYLDKENIRIQREVRTFDVKINYCKKSFGQKYIDYLGSKYFNSMPLDIKKTHFLFNWES